MGYQKKNGITLESTCLKIQKTKMQALGVSISQKGFWIKIALRRDLS